ncbi:MAG: UvrD-helicase domain-containing protein [Bifidobacteriaceae bacterium]|jgi:DNA helicase-2/ATP-dependent DNA helicase PcrA|nr:UvrD-helicase domain-containing protein [Bifidobacteriaceae bacterium]
MVALTEEQQRVVDIDKGFNLVLAPAGSGKTEILAERVIKAIRNGYDYKKMACLTFTVKAGRNMLDRVNRFFSKNQVTIGNVHTICAKLLFDNSVISDDVQIIDEEDSDNFIGELAFGNGVGAKRIDLLKLSTYLTRKSLNFPDTHLVPSKPFLLDSLSVRKTVKEYIREKRLYNYLDFDDILTRAYLWVRDKDNRTKFFDWIQVDEVQDLNPIQLDIISGLTDENGVQVYFGDYSQAIYGFMGANLNSLNELSQRAGKDNVYYLTKNFRSPSYLLELYNDYFNQNLDSNFPKLPIANITEQTPTHSLMICNCGFRNQYDVITYALLPTIYKMRKDDKTAILVRTNAKADAIYTELEAAQIPCFRISGFDLFRRWTMKALMAYLNLLGSSYKKIAWVRLLYAFDIFRTLRESRQFVSSAYNGGVVLNDFHFLEETRLDSFVNQAKYKDIVVFDTETTGLDTAHDDVIQIAAVKLRDGQKIDEINLYINTDRDLAISAPIHHISKGKLDAVGLSHEDGILKFINFCGNESIMVAHNLKYDLDIISNNAARYLEGNLNFSAMLGGKNNFYDSLSLSRIIFPGLKKYKLEYSIEHLSLQGENSHNALDDARATAELVKMMLLNSDEIVEKQNQFILNNQKKLAQIDSKIGPIFSQYENLKYTEKSINKLMSDFVNFLFESNNNQRTHDRIRLDLNEMKKLQKNIAHFVDNSENMKLNLDQKLQKFLPIYNSYNEGDLYIGDEKVLVSTIHKAKGLEFDSVIVPDIDADVYPKDTSQDAADARLLYVAITRAKKALYLTTTGRLSPFIEKVKSHFEIYDLQKWTPTNNH